MTRNGTPTPFANDRSVANRPSAWALHGSGEEAATVLARIRAELVVLHDAVKGLQDTLSPALVAAAGEARVAEAAQGFDLVAQTLDGLSTFLGALSAECPGSGLFDATAAAARVGIGALSSRLAGRPSPASDEVGHGDVELF